MSSDFQTYTYGKWILAGEHAVIRSKPAIVFPIKSHSLSFGYHSSKEALSTKFLGLHQDQLHLLFWGILEFGLERVNKSLRDLSGQIVIDNQIPIGSGMGASAALCVTMSRWFSHQAWIPKDQIFSFAIQLENLFHGESSGLDIAGTMANSGIFYQRNEAHQTIDLAWQPQWYLSSTQQTGITSQCIDKVKKLWASNPSTALRIDEQMEASVLLAHRSLITNHSQCIHKLAEAINLACLCFNQWGLTDGKVEQHIHQLLKQGALAAKPTGSGDGGHVISLWDRPVPTSLAPELVNVQSNSPTQPAWIADSL